LRRRRRDLVRPSRRRRVWNRTICGDEKGIGANVRIFMIWHPSRKSTGPFSMISDRCTIDMDAQIHSSLCTRSKYIVSSASHPVQLTETEFLFHAIF